MVFVDLCAATMRNWHFRDSWLRAVARGCEIAQEDVGFVRSAGACFGGLEIYPASVLGQMWQKTVLELIGLFPRGLLSAQEFKPNPVWLAARIGSRGRRDGGHPLRTIRFGTQTGKEMCNANGSIPSRKCPRRVVIHARKAL